MFTENRLTHSLGTHPMRSEDHVLRHATRLRRASAPQSEESLAEARSSQSLTLYAQSAPLREIRIRKLRALAYHISTEPFNTAGVSRHGSARIRSAIFSRFGTRRTTYARCAEGYSFRKTAGVAHPWVRGHPSTSPQPACTSRRGQPPNPPPARPARARNEARAPPIQPDQTRQFTPPAGQRLTQNPLK
jgi:hypothetical protein